MAQTEETKKEKRKENRASQASVLIHTRLRAHRTNLNIANKRVFNCFQCGYEFLWFFLKR
jgi:hypothetical protein